MVMKEQLISFETAKLAKEKGFDIKVSKIFDRNQEVINTPSIKYRIKELLNNVPKKQIWEEIKRPPFIYAPTQSLLQKWLREEHKISVNVDTGWQKGNFIYECTVWDRSDDTLVKLSKYDPSSTWEDSYEEALEKGLFKALKLVKNG